MTVTESEWESGDRGVMAERYDRVIKQEVRGSPIRGTESDVAGMISATSSMKTVRDSSTVIPADRERDGSHRVSWTQLMSDGGLWLISPLLLQRTVWRLQCIGFDRRSFCSVNYSRQHISTVLETIVLLVLLEQVHPWMLSDLWQQRLNSYWALDLMCTETLTWDKNMFIM